MSDIQVKVHSFGKGRNLSLVWFDPVSGRKCAKTAGTRKQREAERKAAELERELRMGSYSAPSKLTWEDFRELWLDRRAPELSPKTVSSTLSAFNHVKRVLNPDRLAKLTTQTLSGFQAALRAAGMKDTTLACHLRHLRATLAWAHEQGLLAVMPKITRPQRAKGQRFMRGRPINGEEFDRLLLAVPKVRPDDADVWERFLRGLWLSGLRRGESLALSWDRGAGFAVDLSGRRPAFRIKAESQKARRDEIVPMTPDFAQWLFHTAEADRHGRVFRLDNPDTGRPIDEHEVGKIVGEIGRTAGIIVNRTRKAVWEDQPDGTRKKVVKDNVPEFATCHTLRRSFGNRWARRVSTASLKKLMRHASIQTTERYYVDLDAAELAAELWAAWTPERAESGNTLESGNNVGNIRPDAEQPAGFPESQTLAGKAFTEYPL